MLNLSLRFSISVFLLFCCSISHAQRFVGEIERVTNTTANASDSIFVSNTIPQGATAVLQLGWEINNTKVVSSISDSRGNRWIVKAYQLDNTVHQQAIAYSYLGTSLQVNDTITVNWSSANSAAWGIQVVELTGVATNGAIFSVTNGGFGTAVSAPGTVPTNNCILIGNYISEQQIAYANPNWTQIGTSNGFGHTASVTGLQSVYVWTNATLSGSFDPGGTLISGNQSWDYIWVAFQSSGTFFIDFVSGSDTNDGMTTSTPWQHCPGDTNAATANPASYFVKGLTNQTFIFKGGVSYTNPILLSNVLATFYQPLVFDGNTLGTFGTGMAIFNLNSNYYHAFVAPYAASNIILQGFDCTAVKNSFGGNRTNVIWSVTTNSMTGTTNVITYTGSGSTADEGVFYFRNASNIVIAWNKGHEAEQWNHTSQPNNDNNNPITCEQFFCKVDSCSYITATNNTVWAMGHGAFDTPNCSYLNISSNNMGGSSTWGFLSGWCAVFAEDGGTSGVNQNHSFFQNYILNPWQLGGDGAGQADHAGDLFHLFGPNGSGAFQNAAPHNILISSNTMIYSVAFQYANGTACIYTEQGVWNVTNINNLIINAQHIPIWHNYSSNVVDLNNTIVSWDRAGGGAAFGIFVASGATNVMITNNIVYLKTSNSAVQPISVSSGTGNPFSDYNVCYGPNAGGNFARSQVAGAQNYTLAQWQSAFGLDAHSVQGDPKLVNVPSTGDLAATGNYSPATNSPAVGAGANLSGVFTTDITGVPRSVPWTVGAFNVASSSSPSVTNTATMTLGGTMTLNGKMILGQ